MTRKVDLLFPSPPLCLWIMVVKEPTASYHQAHYMQVAVRLTTNACMCRCMSCLRWKVVLSWFNYYPFLSLSLHRQPIRTKSVFEVLIVCIFCFLPFLFPSPFMASWLQFSSIHQHVSVEALSFLLVCKAVVPYMLGEKAQEDRKRWRQQKRYREKGKTP